MPKYQANVIAALKYVIGRQDILKQAHQDLLDYFELHRSGKYDEAKNAFNAYKDAYDLTSDERDRSSYYAREGKDLPEKDEEYVPTKILTSVKSAQDFKNLSSKNKAIFLNDHAEADWSEYFRVGEGDVPVWKNFSDKTDLIEKMKKKHSVKDKSTKDLGNDYTLKNIGWGTNMMTSEGDKWIVERSGSVVGRFHVEPAADERLPAEVTHAFLHDKIQGRGIGSKVYLEFLSRYGHILSDIASSDKAVKVWTKLGAEKINVDGHDRYYLA